jgi:hypothetical protein
MITVYSGCQARYPVQWAAFDGDHTPDPVDGSTATSGGPAKQFATRERAAAHLHRDLSADR